MSAVQQSFAPVHGCTKSFKFHTTVPRCRQRDGFFQTTTGLKPADQNHGESQSCSNLKTFCAPQCLQEDSADPIRNVCTHSANFRYTLHRQGFLPFLKTFLREHFFPFS